MRAFKVIIIGSGFGGQCAALRLRAQGVTDYRILERRDFMGGTWCQNRYPGAAVDVQSPLYSIASEPYRWSQMFAEQDELERYTNGVIEKHGLRDKTELNANVRSARWDEATRRWRIETEASGDFEAQFVINATGPLSTPVVPDMPGRDSFRGLSFHTNNWDRAVDLRGRKVAIVGSGASAAQVIPAIVDDCAELHVFQRSPHWVLPRPDRKFSRLERTLIGIRPLHRALRWAIYWALESRVIGFKYSETMLKKVAQSKAEKHLATQIRDPELRRKLTPDFTIGCKRIILSNTLYPALSRRHVTLHDRDDGIARITENGLVTRSGAELGLDVIVWSTGYDATDGLISYPVTGRDGRSLSDVWSQFPRAYLGTTIPGFPNFFVVTGPNTGIGHTSAIFVIEAQMNYIMRALAHLERAGAETIDVRPDAEDAYTGMIHSEMDRTVWKRGGCRSWYQSKSGHVIAMFPGFSFTYWRLARRFQRHHHVIA
jgi:cation diffusion facilitator CzcD-associated flavoprotein CzcO